MGNPVAIKLSDTIFVWETFMGSLFKNAPQLVTAVKHSLRLTSYTTPKIISPLCSKAMLTA